ncbi:MAG TPA: hypothetical protein VHD84_02070 [Candidatus Saccharimonadales bacterium]|nr:hypothetical protein [Candidatus Saccharimonadales bacterium]
MKTVAVVEGWAGGPRLSRKFRQALEKSGFKLTRKVAAADIIFAHSTGCYLLPVQNQAELIVALDPPYWPGRAITRRWLDLMKTDTTLLKSGAGAGSFVSKKLWEIYYIFAKPRFTWSVLKNQSHLDFLDKHKGQKVILARNQGDEFCSPLIRERLKKYKNVKYVELPGNHEDYYVNPKSYIDLLLKELK